MDPRVHDLDVRELHGHRPILMKIAAEIEITENLLTHYSGTSLVSKHNVVNSTRTGLKSFNVVLLDLPALGINATLSSCKNVSGEHTSPERYLLSFFCATTGQICPSQPRLPCL